jgi:hypothetical protein
MNLLVHPIAPLVTFAIANAATLCALVWVGRQPSGAVELILSFGWSFMLILWMEADSYHRRRRPCFDFGLAAAMFFPLSVPWYCFWSRGWRGVLVLGVIFALWLGPYFAATAVAILRFMVG